MVGMFDNKKTNPEIIRNLKTVFTEKFSVSKDSTISVAELRCHEPNCPPVETVFTVRTSDGSIQDWSCLLYTSPSPRDGSISRMPSSA